MGDQQLIFSSGGPPAGQSVGKLHMDQSDEGKTSSLSENSDLPAGSYRSHVATGLIMVSNEATGWLGDDQFVYWEM